MYSIINKLDKYLKDEKEFIDKISARRAMFSKYLNQAMLHEVRGLYDVFFDDFSRDIIFRRDENGTLYMLLHDVRWRKNIVVLPDSRVFIRVPFEVNKVVFEQELYKNAAMLQYLAKWRDKIGNMLYIPQYPFKNMGLEEAKRFRHIMEYEIVREKIKEINEDLTNQNLTIYDKVPLNENDLHRTTMNIINNIAYLKSLKKDSGDIKTK